MEHITHLRESKLLINLDESRKTTSQNLGRGNLTRLSNYRNSLKSYKDSSQRLEEN